MPERIGLLAIAGLFLAVTVLAGMRKEVPEQQQPNPASSSADLSERLPPARDAGLRDSNPYAKLPGGRIAARGTGEAVTSTWNVVPSEQSRPKSEPPVAGREQRLASERVSVESSKGSRSLREMPPEYRDRFPTFAVEVHQYEKAKDRRFISVGGQTYREGQRLASGISVIEIVEGGVMVLFDGETILYPASSKRMAGAE